MSRAIFDLRRGLYKNGYRPVAIRNGVKYPTQTDWPELARQDPPDACLRPPHSEFLSTGILCDGLRPIDIDIDDPGKTETAVKWLTTNFGDAPRRFRADSPRALLLYAAADGEPSKASAKNSVTKQGVEVLGRGNQFFADGVHPDGCRVEWINGPLEACRSALISINDEQTAEFLTFAATLLDADRLSHRLLNASIPEPLPFSGSGSRDAWFIGDIRSALAQIPHCTDYDDWLRITAAVVAACAGCTDGFAVWLNWSQGCGNYNARAAAQLWNNLRRAPLQRITAGTLWRYVRAFNPAWEKPSTHGFSRLGCFQHKT